jgi:hypothetical protein
MNAHFDSQASGVYRPIGDREPIPARERKDFAGGVRIQNSGHSGWLLVRIPL